jgi:hypothetical protein
MHLSYPDINLYAGNVTDRTCFQMRLDSADVIRRVSDVADDVKVDVPPLRTFTTPDRKPRKEARASTQALAGRLLADYWPLIVALGAITALAASDLQAEVNLFWRQHQAITSLVTGMALTVAVVFGVDRVLKARSRKRWRPIGVRIVEKLSSSIWTEEMLYYNVLSYCQRAFGEANIPPDRSYAELLLEALEDRETWESTGEVPALVDLVDKERIELEEVISAWAPVLISEPDLAAIGASAESLLEAVTQVSAALAYGDASYRSHGPADQWEPRGRLATWLLLGLSELAEAATEMDGLAEAYR